MRFCIISDNNLEGISHTMKRLNALDLLKIIGSIIIMFHHYQQLIGENNTLILFYGGKIYFGYMVEMFFLISGFLCADIKKIQKIGFEKYIKGKIFRIYPMAIISVIATTIVGIIYYIKTKTWFMGIEITLWKIVTSGLLVFCGGAINDGLGINNPLWYLCVLLYCYVILYCIIWGATKVDINPKWGIILMIVLGESIIEWNINIPYFNYYSGRGYVAFFCGFLIYHLWNEKQKHMLYLSSFLLVIAVVSWIVNPIFLLENERECLVYIIFPSILVVLLRIFQEVNINSNALAFWGKVSYEIYLWHLMFIIIFDLINKEYFRFSDVMNDNISLLTFGLCVASFSSLMYLFLEKNINKQIKKVKN